MEFQNLLDAVRDLTPQDRLRQDETEKGGISSEIAAEVQARMARYKSDSVAVPWPEVERRMDKLLEMLGE